MTLKNRIAPEMRRKRLKELLNQKRFLRFIEAHNGISGIVANNTKIRTTDGEVEFDGIWESSLTDSASKGLPDIELVGFESRCENIRQILNCTNKPMIVDGDTGGEASNFEYMVRTLETLGVSAVIIEDKVFPKRNSLEPGARQLQEEPDIFSTKIKRARQILLSDDFMIIARIESLIAGAGLVDAIKRAKKYLQSGADGIMIHSKDNSPDEVLKFAKKYQELCNELHLNKPLISVPTSYNSIFEDELMKAGFNIVIHANQLLRAAHQAMKEVARTILLNHRSLEADSLCSPVKEIFNDVGFSDVTTKDKQYRRAKIPVIIPAAGEDKIFLDFPKAMVEINGKPILQHQVNVLNKCKLDDIIVVTGYSNEKFDVPGVNYVYNDAYSRSSILSSLFCAQEYMKNGFICIYSDILFDEAIIKNLLGTDGDIVLVVDNSYTYHKHDIDKKLDLVVTKQKYRESFRDLKNMDNEIVKIGKNINKEIADYEYIGISYFSEYGAEILKKTYLDLLKNHKGKFHEAESVQMAEDLDIIQELIERKFKVKIFEVHKGWMEIHSQADLEAARNLLR